MVKRSLWVGLPLLVLACHSESSTTCYVCGITEESCAQMAKDAGCASHELMTDAPDANACWGGPGPVCDMRDCAGPATCPQSAATVACACGPYSSLTATVEGVDLSMSPAGITRPGVGTSVTVELSLGGDAPVCLADGSVGPNFPTKRLLISGDLAASGMAYVTLEGDTPFTQPSLMATTATVAWDTSNPDCVRGELDATFNVLDSTSGTTVMRTYHVTGGFSAEKDGR